MRIVCHPTGTLSIFADGESEEDYRTARIASNRAWLAAHGFPEDRIDEILRGTRE